MRTPWPCLLSKTVTKLLYSYFLSKCYCDFVFNFSAVNLGTDMLELDCHITKDKQVVVAHDPSLLRIAGVDALIEDLDYHQLPLL